MSKKDKGKAIEAIIHNEASRKNIPTAEYQAVMEKADQSPVRLAYERRNRDLDPQLVWRGKDEQDLSDLVVSAPPLYIQEKIHPKVLIDDLMRSADNKENETEEQLSLFNDFNGLPEAAKTEFYRHDANWSNRMILGDSLQVMASLAEREGLRGQVQCIYIDPPYGIKFNSNFQWSTTSRDVKDGKVDHITREPEQVKAFRDTWRDGIHSYLTYLRDRLTVSRDLLADSGSIFVQIGDENVHRVRALMDEVFGDDNFVCLINFQKTGSLAGSMLPGTVDYIVWYTKHKATAKYHQLFMFRQPGSPSLDRYDYIETPRGGIVRIPTKCIRGEEPIPEGERCRLTTLLSDGAPSVGKPFTFENKDYTLRHGKHWKTDPEVGGIRLCRAQRVVNQGSTIWYKRFVNDFPVIPIDDRWDSVQIGKELMYVVQTASGVIERCILMATDPGDLVLDPTCGSGTTAYVAEQWGRRWITIDTSRVALALARARLMGARYPYYILADSQEGQLKEAEIAKTEPTQLPTRGDIRHGFTYERVPHIMLKDIANNSEIDVIWDKYQGVLEPLRAELNNVVNQQWEEWEIPYNADDKWSKEAKSIHALWWEQRTKRQNEIDASIAAKSDYEYLYDKPYEDNKKVRVAGPFTVESISPHRVLGVDENDELIDRVGETNLDYVKEQDFTQLILENLKTAGVQQTRKEDKITFASIIPWPGELISAEGRYSESNDELSIEKRAAIFIGPEFGTVSRPDLVAAAREAGDADFDVLIACAFNYDAHSTEFHKLGRIPVLKARMNADLHMADDLKNTGKGNLFVIFGEPDIDILGTGDDQVQVKINGVDVFHPNTGEVRSDGPDGIACWFIDTDYNEESFFVRHAYFLGASDPYKSLKTTLRAEINKEAWLTLHSDTSRPFNKPKSGRIAVKVINHLGDEVMKVFRVCTIDC